ncbi:MAG: endonuclease [Endozoicomonas sp.]|uniref:endonuclease n=1 Tax=Endozoicomonas sp. TaxID=1892382 RepID=UPI003D9BB389
MNFERARNDAVFRFQGNRNPFIDHPHWVELIWGELLDPGEFKPCDDSMQY